MEINKMICRKKLLITASTFPRWENDTEPRFILDLAKYLSVYYDLTVLVPWGIGAKTYEEIEGVKIIRYHYFPIHRWETLCYPGAIVPRIKEKKIRILLVPFLFLSLYFHLIKIIPQYDIVHANWVIPQGMVQSFFDKPYLVTGHGGDITSLNFKLIKYMKRKCLRKAKAITVVSQHLKNKVIELYPEAKVEVISMGCDLHKFGPKYRRNNFFEQDGKKVILFVGRLAEKKGVSYLIDAMRKIDAKLVIVGNGPLMNRLKKEAEPYADKVMFLGSKTHEELKYIYASADIFAAPSITADDGDMEGVPTTILEAMASGLPIVANRTGGIPEVIFDGENGLLCDEKNVEQLIDNLNLLLTNEQLYKNIIDRSIDTVKRFSYENIALMYKSLIESI